MKRIDLYIAGNKADLNEQSLVLMNYTAKELSSPTAVKNSYTQAVKLPATPANNKIFNHILRSDHRTYLGFNPLVRTPFELRDELGAIIEKGYLKLDEGERGKEYSVTLYGGLGSFFYSLMYKEDGEKMNLGDLTYINEAEQIAYHPNGVANIGITANTVADCLYRMMGNEDEVLYPQQIEWSFFLSFAVAYNGIPEGFDANKAIIGGRDYANINVGTADLLVLMENKHDEWEMRDLRAYLQTPIVNIGEVLKAVSVPGYTFSASEAVLDAVSGLWMSLGAIKRAESYTNYPMRDLFEASPSPAEVLIGLAKTFGLVFDVGPGKVELMTREEYYQQGQFYDINKRVDLSKGITVQPISFDTKYYVWKNGLVESGYVKEYRERYGKEYGEQLVNTGTEFNNERTEALEGLAFKGAVMDAEASALMFWQGDAMGAIMGNFIPSLTENCSYVSGGTNVPIYPVASSSPEYPTLKTKEPYNTTESGYDVTEKVSFCDENRKPLSSVGVLLYYAGKKALPHKWDEGAYIPVWHVTDDDTSFFAANNDGVPCWDLRTMKQGHWIGRRLLDMPIFSRYASGKSLDFGMPKETPVPWLNPYNYTPIYERRWADYISDIYDVDSKTMRCFVNFAGMAVDAARLCHFYYYDNAIWVLNKIINYDVVKGGIVQCEFIKVKDKTNYL